MNLSFCTARNGYIIENSEKKQHRMEPHSQPFLYAFTFNNIFNLFLGGSTKQDLSRTLGPDCNMINHLFYTSSFLEVCCAGYSLKQF